MNKDDNINHWVTHLCQAHPTLDSKTLATVFEVATELIKTEAPPDFNMSQQIVEQLLTLTHDTDTLNAGILYPFFTDNEKIKLLIQKKLSPATYKLLRGTKRMETIDKLPIQQGSVTFNPQQLDNLRRMLLAIVDDARIVIIKLAERICTIKQYKNHSESEKREIANQCMALYAPLANRLGIGQFKWQLEDWSFRYLNTKEYAEISKGLNQRRTDREEYIEKVKAEITALLQESGIDKYELTGRAKHIYSIYKKQKRKDVPIEEIYDTNAFRILVPSIHDCYTLLSLFHERYDHVPQEFDDYIAKPKPNGYRSIHTVILGPQNRNVEIQLRTFDMHAEAELGVAAHWKYKESGGFAQSFENKITLLRDIIAWQQDVSQEDESQSEQYTNLFKDRVYVFTPKNDILDLPQGATPLDVAYAIHTEVGHRCKGAKVNNKIVPLTEKIHTGDVIEILTGKESKPSRDWINPDRGYLTTSSAINKVKSWFRHLHQQEKLSRGIELWEKAAKREGISKQELTQILPSFNFKSLDDLFIAIGLGHISPTSLIRKLKPTSEKELEEAEEPITASKSLPRTEAAIANTQNLLSSLARCCNPIPGDDIKGYITKGRGVSIHRADCQNFIAASTLYPERVLDVDWGDKAQQKYPISINIVATERAGLVRDISTLIANLQIRLLGISTQLKLQENTCLVNLTIEIEDLNSLQKILNQLQQLPDIIKATRKI